MRLFRCVLLVVVLAALVFVVGCPKKQAAEPGGGAASALPAPPAGPPPAVASSSDPFADIAGKMKSLKSFEMTITSSKGGPSPKQEVQLADGKLVAARIDAGGKAGLMIINFDKNEMYMYNPATKAAMKMPMGKNNPADAMDKYGPKQLADLQAKHPKVSSETVDGADCWVLETTGAKGETSKLWVDKKLGLTRQVVTGADTTKMTYSRVNEIPNSDFELPKDAKVQSLPAMPNMPGMPKMPKP
ncbi:MAG TPA: DUF4412 domain-containing protein [Armatimonadota bacterium]